LAASSGNFNRITNHEAIRHNVRTLAAVDMATASLAGRCLGLQRRGYRNEHVRRDELFVLLR
jgi:hypothetical protein